MTGRKMSLGRKKDESGVVVPQVPSTTFNFMESAAESIRKIRVASRVVVGASVVVLAAFSFMVFNAGRAAADAEARSEEAVLQRATLSRELQERTGGAVNLPEHVAKRREEIGSALSTDTDAGAVIAQVLSTTPSGVQVTSVSVVGVVSADTPIGAPPSPPKEGDPAPKAPTAEPRVLTIVAQAPNFDAPIEWRNALNSLGVLSEIVVEPTRSGDVVNVRITAKVNDAAAQSRRTEAATAVGPLTGSTPTPAPGGK
jgi:hypothetical protein